MTKRDWNGEFFTSKDADIEAFVGRSVTDVFRFLTIERANAILREEIAKLETVYIDTHQAKLLPPKEMEKK